MNLLALGGALAVLASAAPALAATKPLAAAPQPVKPAPAALFSGRWYQIARIAAADPHPCHGATDDFVPVKGDGFTVTLTCHDNGGHEKRMSVKGGLLPGSGGAKFRVSFLGGLFHQEYWVLDHASDNAWALLATPGGRYLWLLSRSPAPASSEHVAAVGAIKALGYDASKLTADR